MERVTFVYPLLEKMWWPMQAVLWTFMQVIGAFLPIVAHTPLSKILESICILSHEAFGSGYPDF